MVAFEISIATLNHIADRHLVLLNTRGRWTAFVKLAEWDRAGPRLPKGYRDDGEGQKPYQRACPNQRDGSSAAPAHGASDDPFARETVIRLRGIESIEPTHRSGCYSRDLSDLLATVPRSSRGCRYVRAHCDNPLLAPIGPALSNSEFKTSQPDAPS